MVRHAANDATFFDVVLSKRLYAPPFRGIAVPACKKTICQHDCTTRQRDTYHDTGGGTAAGFRGVCMGGGGEEANLAIDTFEKVENKSNGYQTQRCQLP